MNLKDNVDGQWTWQVNVDGQWMEVNVGGQWYDKLMLKANELTS